ncbi:hypothetical protein K0U07_01080 [bacterium]|nr:hypothetical protein [bacterium]
MSILSLGPAQQAGDENFIRNVSFTRVTLVVYMVAFLGPAVIHLASQSLPGRHSTDYYTYDRVFRNYSKILLAIGVIAQLGIAARDFGSACNSSGTIPVHSLGAFFIKSILSLGVYRMCADYTH